ncbi:MAG: PAS domain S-box protein [Polaromonas sp.]
MKVRLTLRTRLVLLVVAAIIPLFGLSIVKAWLASEAAISRATDNLKFSASLAAAAQDQVADSAYQMLLAITHAPGVVNGNIGDCQRYLKTLRNQIPLYGNLAIINLDGQFRCHGLEAEPLPYSGDRDFFKAALSSRAFVSGGYFIGRATGKPSLAFALPMLDSAGLPTAVVFANVNLNELAKVAAGVSLPPGGQLVITDRRGTVLVALPDKPVQVGRQVTSPILLEAVKNMRTGVGEGPDANGEERIFAFLPSGRSPDSRFFVAVSADRKDVVAHAQREWVLETVLLSLVAFLGGWIAWMIGGRAIVGPTTEILEATRQLSGGHLQVRVPIRASRGESEFAKIAEGFNLMADSLQQRERDLELELEKGRQAYATLELTINSMHEALVAVDMSGRFLLINEPARKILDVDEHSAILSSGWAQLQGLFIPGTDTLIAFDDLPIRRALRGESGGPMYLLMKNAREPQGRLLCCSYQPMRHGDEVVGALAVFADVTEVQRLQAEQVRNYTELRETQRKLLDAQRLGRIGNWEFDLATQRLWWSEEVYELFGLAPGGFDGRHETLMQMIHPDDRTAYAGIRDHALAVGGEFDTEYRIVTPGGEVRWIHQLGKPVFNDAGQISYRAGVVQEITARKLSELQAARHTELLNRTGEMAKIGGWELLLDSMTLVCSDEVYRIHEVKRFRYTPLDVAMDFYAPEARPVIRAAIQAGIDHATPWDLMLPLTTAAGRRIQVRVQGKAIQQDGKTVRLVGALQDVTQQHEAQAHLHLLEAAVSRLNDIVLITDAEPIDAPGPRIVFVNDAFVRRTGFSREEALGQSPRLLQGPKTQRAELDRIRAALEKSQPVRAELINYTKSGEEFWVELDIVPIADAKGRFTHWVSVERDVTQRKLAEQALVQSEQRYAALFESAPVPMWMVDVQTHRFLAVNEACLTRYGFTRDEFLEMTSFDIRSEIECRRLKDEIAGGTREDSNRRLHMRKDGTEFHVETVSKLVQYDGRPARFVVALDVTAQAKAEKDVQDYLFTLQRAADAAQAITGHQTLEGAMQEVVEQARGVIGVHRAVLTIPGESDTAQSIRAISLSEKHGAQNHALGTTLAPGFDAGVGEISRPIFLSQAELLAHPRWRHLAHHGDVATRFRGWLAVPLVRSDGHHMGLLQMTDRYEGEFTQQDAYVAVELAQMASIAIENVRLLEQVHSLNSSLEKKVAERTAALARQEALARALTEQAPQVVWHADASGALTYANRKWYELMGGTATDWLGQEWLKAIHPDDRKPMVTNWYAASRSLTAYVGTRRVFAKDGIYHTMSYKASPVLDDNGQVDFWVGIDADITEIKAIESALRLSNQELEAFSYSVSHDLRSPLNTINGFSQLLAKRVASNADEKVQHYLSRIQAGVGQMGRLIEDLLSLAQVSRAQLTSEQVDLSALAHHILDEWRARDPLRRVTVHIEEGLLAHGDVRLVRVVMENLLGNAWKFSSQLAQAEVTVGQKAGTVGTPVFFVRDNGAGFDMAYADKLFTPFQRLHAVSEFPGTGIGLATVSRVISRHGGQLWAESAPGCGATFFFTLPKMTAGA